MNLPINLTQTHYNEDITDFVGDSLVEEQFDDTEPGGNTFDSGNPLREYQNQEIRELNSR